MTKTDKPVPQRPSRSRWVRLAEGYQPQQESENGGTDKNQGEPRQDLAVARLLYRRDEIDDGQHQGVIDDRNSQIGQQRRRMGEVSSGHELRTNEQNDESRNDEAQNQIEVIKEFQVQHGGRTLLRIRENRRRRVSHHILKRQCRCGRRRRVRGRGGRGRPVRRGRR